MGAARCSSYVERSSRRISVPAMPRCFVSLEHEKQGRESPDESAPDGPLIEPSRGGHHLKLSDEGHTQPTSSSEPLQSPIEINVLAHVPRFIIAAEFMKCALAAELTGSLRHAVHKT